jgi:hypothetical protein
MHRYTLTVLLLLAALPAAAQQRTLLPGDEVRVVAPSFHRGSIRGELVRYMGDTLAVREASTDSVHVLPMYAIRGLARNDGRHHGRSIRRGGVLGAFVGGAIGLVAGPFIAAASDGDDDGSFLGIVAISGTAGLAAGGTLGLAGGALLSGDHWQSFTMPAQHAAPRAAQR